MLYTLESVDRKGKQYSFYGQIACKFGNIFHGFDLYKGSTIWSTIKLIKFRKRKKERSHKLQSYPQKKTMHSKTTTTKVNTLVKRENHSQCFFKRIHLNSRWSHGKPVSTAGYQRNTAKVIVRRWNSEDLDGRSGDKCWLRKCEAQRQISSIRTCLCMAITSTAGYGDTTAQACQLPAQLQFQKRPCFNEMVCRIKKQGALTSICAQTCTLILLHTPYFCTIPLLTHTKGHEGQILGRGEGKVEKSEAQEPETGNETSTVPWRNKQLFSLSVKHEVAVIQHLHPLAYVHEKLEYFQPKT